MATRRRAARGTTAQPPIDPAPADNTALEQGRPILQPKPKKPTVAQNAQAINNLAQKITGVDAQLSTMNALLAQLAASKNTDSVQTPNLNSQHELQQHTVELQSAFPNDGTGVTPRCTMQPPAFPALGRAPTAGLTPLAGQPATYGQHSNPNLYSAGGTAALRARHHTTPAGQPPYPAGHPPYPATPGWPSTVPGTSMGNTLIPGAHPHTLTAFNQPPPVNPWDHPTTLHDLEADPALTRRVAEALTAVTTPFSGLTGKHAQFPHHLVTRGPKKAKTNLGELSMAEYTWGFLQIVKTKDFSDEAIPFMNTHLERVLEDAMMYEWSDVRKWSEEVCTRIAKNTLRWSDTYIIDRLQTQLSHKNPLGQAQSTGGATPGRTDAYEMSESVRQAKPGPPCKFFQTGTCTHTNGHVQKGYHQLHVCSYCLANKCLLQPHSSKECKTKKFNSQRKGNTESGFGN